MMTIESKNNTPLIVDLIRGLWNGHTPYPTIDKQIKVNMEKRFKTPIAVTIEDSYRAVIMDLTGNPLKTNISDPYLEFVKEQLENDD